MSIYAESKKKFYSLCERFGNQLQMAVEQMNSLKLTNILLLVLVLLLCFHVGLETFRPIGRYVRVGGGSSLAVLDTSQGIMYIAVGPGDGRIINVVDLTKKFHNQSAVSPSISNEPDPDRDPPQNSQ